ncbi:hypothetical protein E8E12_006445 [Didymella heteroderae]|uniref:Uncharacterized protein n=1 Tax=Didymella heteroderae TaxID=1769908 RepID=A0A9P4WTI2_9PLEO|nr:hypothetical protein E8E12_006445 [Didymella heteroderae]
MVRSCIPSFPDLSFLFYSKTTPPHLSPLKPRTCDLTATLHTSWQPSTCPQKCAGLCSHPPPGVETRVNGQLVSAAVPKKVLTPIAEGIDGRENVDIAAQAIKDADKVDEGSAGGSGAGLLTVSATAVSEVNNVDGERTPDLTSLLSDDGSEPANLNAEHLIKKRSGFADQLTADWLATLPSLPDSDLEPDDNASVLALYDVEFDDDEGLGTQAKHDQSPTHVHLLTSGSTTSALSLPFNAIDEAVYTDVNLDGEVDRLDPQPADERYLRPLSVPAGKDIDVWCEIAASPTVVKDVTKTLVANPDGKGMEGKKERPLSHVFFFENWKSSMQP